jgi:hypothetical protein
VTVRKQQGYLFIDHRNSPGISAADAFRAGYLAEHVGEGKVYESHTLTCAHCKTCVVKNPFRQRERARCFKCDSKEGAYICDGCHYLSTLPDYVHQSYLQRIEKGQ